MSFNKIYTYTLFDQIIFGKYHISAHKLLQTKRHPAEETWWFFAQRVTQQLQFATERHWLTYSLQNDSQFNEESLFLVLFLLLDIFIKHTHAPKRQEERTIYTCDIHTCTIYLYNTSKYTIKFTYSMRECAWTYWLSNLFLYYSVY